MIYSLPDFVVEYRYYLLGLAVVCAVLCYRSKRFCGILKKALVVCVCLFVLAAGYELVTGKSIFNLPGRVNKQLTEDQSNPETGHRYYKDYEERYGEKPPE